MTAPYDDIAATRLLHALQDTADPQTIVKLSTAYAATQPPNSPKESSSPTSEEIVIGKVLSLKKHDRLMAMQTLAEIADLALPVDNTTNRGELLAMKATVAWNEMISEPQSKSHQNVTRLISAHETFKFAANPYLKNTAAQAVINIAREPGNTFKQADQFAEKMSTYLRRERESAITAISSEPPPPART